MAGLPLPTGKRGLEALVEGLRAPVQRRSDREGQRHGHRDLRQPGLEAWDADGDDQPEFAVGPQRQRGEERIAGTEPEGQQQAEEQRGLERQGQQQQSRDGPVRGGRQAGQPDLQEEGHEEDLLHRPQRVAELARPRMPGDQHPDQQRAQLPGHAKRRETHAAEHQGKAEAGEDQQFIVAAAVEQAEQQWAQQWQAQQQHGPGRRRLAAPQGQRGQRHEILHDQDADRHATVECREFALSLEHLGRQHGARERQRDGDEERLRPANADGEHQHRREQRDDDRAMQQPAADHRRLRDLSDLQLEPDGEQQQQDADVCEVADGGDPAVGDPVPTLVRGM